MSVPTTEPTPTAAPAATEPKTPEAPQDGQRVETFDAEYVSKLRSENAKYRTEAKANADAAAKLAAIEEASKTEAQKLADRLAAAEAKAAESELKALRAEVAQTKGVPAALLTGSNADELTAAADALIAFRGEAPKLPAAPSAAGQGKVGEPVGAGAPQLTADDLKRMTAEKRYDDITKARAEGRFNALLGIS